MKKFVVSFNNIISRVETSGSKARTDVNYLLKKNGFEEITFSNNSKSLIFRTIKFILFLLKLSYQKIEFRHETIVFLIQSPGNKTFKILKFIFRKAIFIYFIHDVYYLQNESTVSKDEKDKFIRFLNKFDYIISHNQRMKKEFIDSGVKNEKIYTLELFDYLIDNDFQRKRNYNPNKVCVVYAGNLNQWKSKFIYKLDQIANERLTFSLYGIDFDRTLNPAVNQYFKGVFKPEKLPSILEGDYGLIWDGEVLNTCNRNVGNYLRYNNPHKLSLYIVSYLPVICWHESAVSEIVKREKIGIVIKSLEDLDKQLLLISKDDYEFMRDNVIRLREKITNGFFTSRVISQIMESISANDKKK
ncbi:MAG TPA: hypothetical protein ENO30_03140 [Thermodesulfobium narugense]|nr:hypothetical protein [Thermodesulfobium narugense]